RWGRRRSATASGGGPRRPAVPGSPRRIGSEGGRDCRTAPRPLPGGPRAAGPALLPVPEVGQAGHVPPGPGLGVVAPRLGMAQAAFGHGVAVDHADLDLAQGFGVAPARGDVPVVRDLDLAVALEV